MTLVKFWKRWYTASNKRSHSPVQAEAVSNKAPRVESVTEIMLIEALLAEKHSSVESLVAGFIQKKLQTELPHSHNPPALQERIDQAKVVEFVHTLLDEKRAIQIIPASSSL